MLTGAVELEATGEVGPLSLERISPHHRDDGRVVELGEETELSGSLERGEENISGELANIAHTDTGQHQAVTLQAGQTHRSLVFHLEIFLSVLLLETGDWTTIFYFSRQSSSR